MIKAVIFDMFETLVTHYHTPLYFGAQMAADAGIPEEQFLPRWRSTDEDRTLGKMSVDEVVEMILRENNCYSEKLFKKIVGKRKATKEDCFRHLHPEIIPMFSELKKKGILIGLISNCYSEESEVIRKSELFPFFDSVCLSCEQGIQKPDIEIFQRCMDELSVKPEECIYVGDGGSYELETAQNLGMKAIQAVWYLQEGTTQPVGRKPAFWQVESPMKVLDYARSCFEKKIEIKEIDSWHKQDINIPNEPFSLFGRMIPSYENEQWSYGTSYLEDEKVREMCFPDENYNYDVMKEHSVFLGAYDGDKCIGLAILQDAWFDYMYLYDLKVAKEYRQKGVATDLIQKAKEIAKKRNYNGLYTQGQDNNLAACQFYLKVGFYIGGLDTNVYKGTKQEGKADIIFYMDC